MQKVSLYNGWKKHSTSNVLSMNTIETPQTVHEQIVTLLPRLGDLREI